MKKMKLILRLIAVTLIAVCAATLAACTNGSANGFSYDERYAKKHLPDEYSFTYSYSFTPQAVTSLAGAGLEYLGCYYYPVLSDSMCANANFTKYIEDGFPASEGGGSKKLAFDAGDTIQVKAFTEKEKLEIRAGDVIAYYDRIGQTVIINTHRVIGVEIIGDAIYIQTKGDNSPQPDPFVKTNADIIGAYTGNKCADGISGSFTMEVKIVCADGGYYLSVDNGSRYETHLLFVKNKSGYDVYSGNSAFEFEKCADGEFSTERAERVILQYKLFMHRYLTCEGTPVGAGSEELCERQCLKYVFEGEGQIVAYVETFSIEQRTGVCMRYAYEAKGYGRQAELECTEFMESAALPAHL